MLVEEVNRRGDMEIDIGWVGFWCVDGQGGEGSSAMCCFMTAQPQSADGVCTGKKE